MSHFDAASLRSLLRLLKGKIDSSPDSFVILRKSAAKRLYAALAEHERQESILTEPPEDA